MKWTVEAEAAIKKVPFFVRNRVRGRVQEDALKEGKQRITMVEVKATQERFLTGMHAEVKGHQIDSCFGASGCPHAVAPNWELTNSLDNVLQQAELLEFLNSQGIQELRFHHQFRVALAGCPNACSQPQIKDIGIIGALQPMRTDEFCTTCGTCVDSCREDAITLGSRIPGPIIDTQRCLACGSCIPACPTGTLAVQAQGYRIQLGGKLGRHPRLAMELPGIFDAATILEIVGACIEIYKSASKKGERFGEILRHEDISDLARRFSKDLP